MDVGCGYGRVLLPLAKAGWNVIGIDLSEEMIAEARRRAREKKLFVRLDLGDMTALPYSNESFDKIICLWNVFNELLTQREQIRTLNEIFRVLKAGGEAFLVIRDGEQKNVKEDLKKRGTGSDKKILKGAAWGTAYSWYAHDRSTLKKICEKSSFTTYAVRFKYMNGRRRIAVSLYKT